MINNLNIEKILNVHHWTDTLFSFICTRTPSFRFLNGQFIMLGLLVNGKPLLRAYSMVSANYEEHLEFLSIKVKNGPLTSRLQHLKIGDQIFIGRKPTGTLVINNLLPGKRLWLISTGTGLAPFMSLIKDPEIYENYSQIILTHTCRFQNELAYQHYITELLPQNKYFGAIVKKKLIYYSTVTRENYQNMGRITELILSGKLFKDLRLPSFSIEKDRFMICGSSFMIKDLQNILENYGFTSSHNTVPGHFVVERAFVD